MTNLDNSASDPFDDGPGGLVHWSSVTISFASGTNTTEFDSYRQGVELALPRHYTKGIVKIHSGDEDHELRQTTFGQSKAGIIKGRPYEDVACNYSPSEYIEPGSVIDLELLNSVADSDDGACAPLAIRINDANSNYYSVKASFIGGNSDSRNADELIVTKFVSKEAIS